MAKDTPPRAAAEIEADLQDLGREIDGLREQRRVLSDELDLALYAEGSAVPSAEG